MDTTEIILEELREFRAAVGSWQQQMGERVASVEVQVKSGITGNGQPSRLHVIEAAVAKLQSFRWYLLGLSAGVSGAVSVAAWLIDKALR